MAGPGSGIAAQIGIGDETTWSSAVTVDHFTEFNTEGVEKEKGILQGQGIHAGGLVDRASRRVVATKSGRGPVDFNLPYRGLGLWMKHILGCASPTVTQIGTTSVYKQVHTFGSARGLGFTYQKGVPQTDGTVQPFTFSGGKILDAEISVTDQQIAKIALNALFRDVSTVTALAAASYPADNGNFSFADAVLKIGGTATTTGGVVSVTGGTQAVTLFTGASVKVNRVQDDKRFGLGNQGLMSEPLENAFQPLTGQLDGEFTSRSEIWDVMASDASTTLQLTFTSTVQIGTTGQYPTVDIILPSVKFDTASIGVGGPGVVKQTVPFAILDDQANTPIQVTIISEDTAI